MAETGEMAISFIYSHFQLPMKVGLSIQLNCSPTFKNDLEHNQWKCRLLIGQSAWLKTR